MSETVQSETDSEINLLPEGLPRRVAVFRALQLGDMLCAVPAFRSLRTAWPRAEITLIGLPWARAFATRFSAYLDHFLEFPGFCGIPERLPDQKRMATFLKQSDSQRFDLAIQLHGNGSVSNAFVRGIGAKFTAGFYPAEGTCPDPRCYIPYPDQGSEIARLLVLTRFLGAPDQGADLLFPLTSYDRREAEEILAEHQLAEDRFAVVHPGSRDSERRWAAQNFADVARFLIANGLDVVLTGSEEERSLTESVARQIGSRVTDVAGKTSLGGLAALLNRSRLVLSNDTGVSHLAAALRIPSVVIFTGSDPRRWAPLDPMLHRTVGDPFTDPPRRPDPEEVRREVAQLVSRESWERIAVRRRRQVRVAPLEWADIERLLLIMTGGIKDLEQVFPAVRALRETLPCCRIVLLAFGTDRVTGEDWEEFRLSSEIDDLWTVREEDDVGCSAASTSGDPTSLERRIRESNFDTAVVFTPSGQTPYPAAYRCYLAGVPQRVGASGEFGGGLLTHWVSNLSEELDPINRHLKMLESVGLEVMPSELLRQESISREAR